MALNLVGRLAPKFIAHPIPAAGEFDLPAAEGSKMRAIHFTTLLMACGFVVAMAAPAPKVDKGLDGTWAVVSSEHDPALGPLPKDLVWVFTDGKITAGPKAGGESTVTYTVKIDSTKSPKEIDLTQKFGERTVTLRGIYRVEKGRLTICLGVAAGDAKVVESDRPEEFEAHKNVQVLILEPSGK